MVNLLKLNENIIDKGLLTGVPIQLTLVITFLPSPMLYARNIKKDKVNQIYYFQEISNSK